MRRVLGVFVLILVWFALFDVPSAVAICRHAPIWLALAVGGVCLALPFGWHLVRERKKAEKSTLRGWDRLILRTVVVAIIVGFGSWAVAKPDLWTALKHHWDWMFPRSSHVSANSKLLDMVPADADTVVWIRAGESPAFAEKLEALGGMAPEDDVELVGAAELTEAMLAVRGPSQLVDGIQRLVDLANGFDGAFTTREKDGANVWTTPKWKDSGHATALVAMLERAPADATVILAAGPGSKSMPHKRHAKPHDDIQSLVGWLRVDDDRIEVTVEVDTPSEAVAVDLIAELEVVANTSDKARCYDGAWNATHEGGLVTVHYEADLDDLAATFACLK
jgi:hypothetical protein